MDAADKKKFIKSLCNAVRDDLLSKVGNMPDAWDGIELRHMIAGAFASEAKWRDMDRRRLRSFRNEVVTRNL